MPSTRKQNLKIGLISLGCPKNLVDSEVMLGHLQQRGYELTPDAAQAQVLIVNTCGFIESAKKESIDAILEAASMKEKGQCQKLIVAGCMVERYHAEMAKELPEVDAFLGPTGIEHILDLVEGPTIQEPVRIPGYLYDHTSPRLRTTPKAWAYLKISEGCDHACAFCAIPQIRGPQRSRSLESIRLEAERLVSEGVLEINLVGQDTTDYGRDLGLEHGLPHLVRELGQVKDLRWFRIHYTYPNRLTDELLRAMAETHNCAPYLDIPLQHADRGVLKGMGRGGGRSVFTRLIHRARRILPQAFLRSNFIVGYPGESPEAFQELLGFLKEVQFDHVGAFTYSPEEGTPAFVLGDPIPRRTKESRQRKLMELQQGISLARNRRLVGQTLEVLVEGHHEETELLLKGRHAGQAPEVDGSVLIVDGEPRINAIQPVLITQAHAYDLIGEVVEE